MGSEQRLDLVGHLEELRTRILRSLLYASGGMILGWLCYDYVYAFITHPVASALRAAHGHMAVTSFMEGFWTRCQVSFVGGLLVVSPLVLWEIWGFVAPGLTPRERQAVRPLLPAAGLLFVLGAATGYLLTARFASWMLSYVPKQALALLTLNQTVLLLAKLYLAFGLSFELPIVIVLLARLGLVQSSLLTARWREAVVVVFVVAAVITPSWDPFTMCLAALPMCVLYLGTIQVIRWMEKRRAGQEAMSPSVVEMPGTSLSGN